MRATAEKRDAEKRDREKTGRMTDRGADGKWPGGITEPMANGITDRAADEGYAGLTPAGMFWLFMLGSFLGFWIETVFCLVTTGKLTNRSSVVYGPFSSVWGFGTLLLTVALCAMKRRGAGKKTLFFAGAFLGGVYEFAYSWLQEQWYGAVFWDYSMIPLNLQGRINLLFCIFWGGAAVIWIEYVYPKVRAWAGRFPAALIKPLTLAALLLMTCNIAVSSLVITRSVERHRHVEARDETDVFLDRHFPDDRVRRIYPDMTYVETRMERRGTPAQTRVVTRAW